MQIAVDILFEAKTRTEYLRIMPKTARKACHRCNEPCTILAQAGLLV